MEYSESAIRQIYDLAGRRHDLYFLFNFLVKLLNKNETTSFIEEINHEHVPPSPNLLSCVNLCLFSSRVSYRADTGNL